MLPKFKDQIQGVLSGMDRVLFRGSLRPPVDPDSPLSAKEKRRRSAAVSRKLRLLRAHGFIQKDPKTHRYQVTSHGRLAIPAILTMYRTSSALLNKAAA